MKLFLLSLLLFTSLLAQNLSWRGNYDHAYREALAQEKPLLVLLVKADDPRTQAVLKEVFANQPYLQAIRDKMITVLITYGSRVSYPIELYYTTEFPALFIVDKIERFMVPSLYGEEITPEVLTNILHVLKLQKKQ